MEKKAMFIEDISHNFNGDVGLYKLDPPYKYKRDYDDDGERTVEYVAVSAVFAMFSGKETYIFPANEKGEITSWGELEGSYRGDLNHDRALRGLGYEVIHNED